MRAILEDKIHELQERVQENHKDFLTNNALGIEIKSIQL